MVLEFPFFPKRFYYVVSIHHHPLHSVPYYHIALARFSLCSDLASSFTVSSACFYSSWFAPVSIMSSTLLASLTLNRINIDLSLLTLVALFVKHFTVIDKSGYSLHCCYYISFMILLPLLLSSFSTCVKLILFSFLHFDLVVHVSFTCHSTYDDVLIPNTLLISSLNLITFFFRYSALIYMSFLDIVWIDLLDHLPFACSLL